MLKNDLKMNGKGEIHRTLALRKYATDISHK